RFEGGASVSFAELDRRSTRLAQGLVGLGLRPGDRLLALLLNGPSFLPLLLAANKVGAGFVTGDPGLEGAFLEHQLRNSAPRIVALDRELASALPGIDLAGVESILLVGEGGPGAEGLDGPRLVELETLEGRVDAASQLVEPLARDISTVI